MSDKPLPNELAPLKWEDHFRHFYSEVVEHCRFDHGYNPESLLANSTETTSKFLLTWNEDLRQSLLQRFEAIGVSKEMVAEVLSKMDEEAVGSLVARYGDFYYTSTRLLEWYQFGTAFKDAIIANSFNVNAVERELFADIPPTPGVKSPEVLEKEIKDKTHSTDKDKDEERNVRADTVKTGIIRLLQPYLYETPKDIEALQTQFKEMWNVHFNFADEAIEHLIIDQESGCLEDIPGINDQEPLPYQTPFIGSIVPIPIQQLAVETRLTRITNAEAVSVFGPMHPDMISSIPQKIPLGAFSVMYWEANVERFIPLFIEAHLNSKSFTSTYRSFVQSLITPPKTAPIENWINTFETVCERIFKSRSGK